MSWGTDLWDQYDHLAFHTQKGIDFLERYGHFIRDRCSIELEYAGKLRRLVKSYQPKKKEDDEAYSTCKAFKLMMNEVNDMAGQHEVIAENLQTEVIKEVSLLIKDFKEERKKLLAEGARLGAQLTSQLQHLDRSRKNYEKAFKEAERALDNYQKADADFNLSRAEVEKQKMNMTMKSQVCEDAKNEYANQLQRTNEQQRQHYQVLIPEVFRQLQDLDEKRIRNIKNYMIQSVQVERNVFPIINQCLDGIINAANQVNEKEDTLQVIERYKSGFDPPCDIPFDDLSRTDGPGAHTPNSFHSTPSFRSGEPTVKGTVSMKHKKRPGIFSIFSSNKNNLSGNGDYKEDYSDLPPNQRKKKLQSKLEELQAKIHQESAARDGLMKMKGVYEQNPNLGDPMSIEGQLNESGHKLDKLRQELQKYQALLDDTNQVNSTNHNNSNHSNSNGIIQNHRNSSGSTGDDHSLSRSASDLSDTKHSAPGTPLPSHPGNSDSPESGIGASHSSLPESDEGPQHYYETELLPPLGTCKALYAFEATSEGSMDMIENEELLVIEADQGDGWTRVRRQVDSTEGFVPTSYIQLSLYNC